MILTKIATKLRLRSMIALLTALIVFGNMILMFLVVSNSFSKILKGNADNVLQASLDQREQFIQQYIEQGEMILKGFARAPIIAETLKNPTDEALVAKAQAYTVDYYNSLNNWEGIYLADWNSQVLTHPAPPVVGRVMREGERLA